MFEGPGNPSAPGGFSMKKPAHSGNVKTDLAGCIFFATFRGCRDHGAALAAPPFFTRLRRVSQPLLKSALRRPKPPLPARPPRPEAQLRRPTVRPPNSA